MCALFLGGGKRYVQPQADRGEINQAKPTLDAGGGGGIKRMGVKDHRGVKKKDVEESRKRRRRERERGKRRGRGKRRRGGME